MTSPPGPAQERDLALRILHQALDDLRLESTRVGRRELFDALYPSLLDPSWPTDALRCEGHSASEVRLALQRLRERLRERVNAHLRAWEPDPELRRALRRRLQAQSMSPRDAS